LNNFPISYKTEEITGQTTAHSKSNKKAKSKPTNLCSHWAALSSSLASPAIIHKNLY
jgi:hypothetical protein